MNACPIVKISKCEFFLCFDFWRTLVNQMRVRTKLFFDRAFAKAAQELWNSLPQSLRDIMSLDQFKSRFKTFLFLNGWF